MPSTEAAARNPADLWGTDLLVQLDWKRLAEVAVKVVESAGFECRQLEQDADGGGLYVMARESQPEQRTHLRIAPWDSVRAEAELVERFHRRLVAENLTNGILIAPGGFSEDALCVVGDLPVELVDGETFLNTLRRLPSEEQTELFDEATSGDCLTPTCPRCGERMAMRNSEAPEYDGKGEDVRFRNSMRVRRQIRCDSLIVESRVRVSFHKSVHCKTMIVRGRVNGNVECQGTVEVHPEARINGVVAARAVRRFSGGIVNGEIRTFSDGVVRLPDSELGVKPVWGCTAYPVCKAVLDCPREI